MIALEPLRAYFDGEKNAGIFVALLGLAAIAFAVWLWRDGGSFRAMLYPLAVVGLLQAAIGIGLYVRTGPQVAALEQGLGAGDRAATAAERTRMDRVNHNWIIIEIIEVVLLAAAVALIFAMRARPGFVAVGMGLAVEAAMMLAFDLFAEERARIYTEWLRALVA